MISLWTCGPTVEHWATTRNAQVCGSIFPRRRPAALSLLASRTARGPGGMQSCCRHTPDVCRLAAKAAREPASFVDEIERIRHHRPQHHVCQEEHRPLPLPYSHPNPFTTPKRTRQTGQTRECEMLSPHSSLLRILLLPNLHRSPPPIDLLRRPAAIQLRPLRLPSL